MNRVKKYRTAAGLSQSDLARQTGLTRNTIAMMEERGSRLQQNSAALLSKVLKVPIGVLTGVTSEGYNWQDGESYWPKKEGSYLAALKKKHYNDYYFLVLDWKNNAWWLTTLDGELLTRINVPVLWWSEINEPPI